MRASRKYYVVYEKWNGDRVVPVIDCIGYFPDDTYAQAAARDYETRKGIHLVDLRRQTRLEVIQESIGDFVAGPILRLVRIALAAVMFLIALPIFLGLRGIGSTPLGQLTMSSLGSAVLQAGVALGLGALCVWIAFGPSRRPQRP